MNGFLKTHSTRHERHTDISYWWRKQDNKIFLWKLTVVVGVLFATIKIGHILLSGNSVTWARPFSHLIFQVVVFGFLCNVCGSSYLTVSRLLAIYLWAAEWRIGWQCLVQLIIWQLRQPTFVWGFFFNKKMAAATVWPKFVVKYITISDENVTIVFVSLHTTISEPSKQGFFL